MEAYDIGDVVRIKGDFTNPAGSYLDPGQVKVKVKTPTGVITTYTYGVDAAVVKDAIGRYHVDLEPTVRGIWKYRFEGNVSNKGAGEASFFVRNSWFD